MAINGWMETGAGTREKQGQVWINPSSSESPCRGKRPCSLLPWVGSGGDAGWVAMVPAKGGTGSLEVSGLLQENQH